MSIRYEERGCDCHVSVSLARLRRISGGPPGNRGGISWSLDSFVVELVALRGMAMLRTSYTVALPVLSAYGQTLDIDVTFGPVAFLAGLCRDTESNVGIRASETILRTFQSAQRPFRGIGRHPLNVYIFIVVLVSLQIDFANSPKTLMHVTGVDIYLH